jgi:hypothetical protein
METGKDHGSHALSLPISERLTRFVLLKNNLQKVKETIKPEAGLDHFLAAIQQSTKLQMQVQRNDQGQEIWQVYDPMTNSIREFASETEGKLWLEQQQHN